MTVRELVKRLERGEKWIPLHSLLDTSTPKPTGGNYQVTSTGYKWTANG